MTLMHSIWLNSEKLKYKENLDFFHFENSINRVLQGTSNVTASFVVHLEFPKKYSTHGIWKSSDILKETN